MRIICWICCKKKPKKLIQEEETKLGGIQDILSIHANKLIKKETGIKKIPIQEILKGSEDSKFTTEKCQECNKTSEDLENSLKYCFDCKQIVCDKCWNKNHVIKEGKEIKQMHKCIPYTKELEQMMINNKVEKKSLYSMV